MSETPFVRIDGGIRLVIRLTPRARRDEIMGLVTGVDGRPALAVRLAAPPVEGQANAALIAFLARLFSVPKAQVRLHSGETARLKRIDIAGDGDRIGALIERWIQSS